MHAVQLNNPGVQQSVHQALQEDPHFARFIENAQVSLQCTLSCCVSSCIVQGQAITQCHQCTLLGSCPQTSLWHVQGPSNLLPAPPSEVVIEDITDAPAQVIAQCLTASRLVVQPPIFDLSLWTGACLSLLSVWCMYLRT